MAAGLGFKTFTTGEVLTAADTNGYLMQGVLVFASAAARDAAITSPQEGQCCYLKDTDAVLTYSGAAWVGFDDTNAIQNTIVDAKGDIIGATAADTPARLAVGANDTVLTADSTQATGLKWAAVSAGGTWQTYSPTIGNFTIGNGTANYRYSQTGKTVSVNINIVLGSTSSVSANPNFSLPVESKYDRAAFTGAFTDAGAGFYAGIAFIEQGAYSYVSLKAVNANSTYSSFTDVSSTVPFTWTSTDEINFQFTYEAA